MDILNRQNNKKNKNFKNEVKGKKGYCAKRVEGSVYVDLSKKKIPGMKYVKVPAYGAAYYTDNKVVQEEIEKCEDVIDRSKVTEDMVKVWRDNM